MTGRAAPSVGGVHWPELDGLRALAITLVVARHSLRPFLSEDAYVPVAAWSIVDLTPLFLNGWVGVDLFFVLSGFLIGRQALRHDGWGRFWFKRITRIAPAYGACLALVAIGLTASGGWPERAWDMAAHLAMLQDYTGSVFVPAFWSLGVEEKFYLLAPFLALALVRVRSPRAQGAVLAALWCAPVAARAIAAAAVPLPLTYADYFPLFRSPFHLTCESLVLGFTIAWASVHQRPVLRPRHREALFWLGATVVIGALAPVVLLGRIGWTTVVAAPAAIGLAFGAMVLACVSGPGTYSRGLAWRGWRPLAAASFSLYLTHMMVIPLALAGARGLPGVTAGGPSSQWLAFLPWYLGLATVSAWALYALVERPVLDWRDQVLNRERPGLLAGMAPHASAS